MDTITTDMWIAPDPPQIEEIQDFDRRMGEKMMQGMDVKALMATWKANAANGAAMSQMLGNQPGAAAGMARMSQEMAKLKGTHVLEVTSMGGTGPAATAPAATPAAPANNNSGGSVAGLVAAGTAQGTAQGEAGRFGVVGTSLSNSVIGAFHRKKQQPAQQAAPAAAPASATAPATQSVVLMETTSQETNFSSEPVPVSVFQVPAGYKQVPTGMDGMGH
jgi:hypothetical protein